MSLHGTASAPSRQAFVHHSTSIPIKPAVKRKGFVMLGDSVLEDPRISEKGIRVILSLLRIARGADSINPTNADISRYAGGMSSERVGHGLANLAELGLIVVRGHPKKRTGIDIHPRCRGETVEITGPDSEFPDSRLGVSRLKTRDLRTPESGNAGSGLGKSAFLDSGNRHSEPGSPIEDQARVLNSENSERRGEEFNSHAPLQECASTQNSSAPHSSAPDQPKCPAERGTGESQGASGTAKSGAESMEPPAPLPPAPQGHAQFTKVANPTEIPEGFRRLVGKAYSASDGRLSGATLEAAWRSRPGFPEEWASLPEGAWVKALAILARRSPNGEVVPYLAGIAREVAKEMAVRKPRPSELTPEFPHYRMDPEDRARVIAIRESLRPPCPPPPVSRTPFDPNRPGAGIGRTFADWSAANPPKGFRPSSRDPQEFWDELDRRRRAQEANPGTAVDSEGGVQ